MFSFALSQGESQIWPDKISTSFCSFHHLSVKKKHMCTYVYTFCYNFYTIDVLSHHMLVLWVLCRHIVTSDYDLIWGKSPQRYDINLKKIVKFTVHYTQIYQIKVLREQEWTPLYLHQISILHQENWREKLTSFEEKCQFRKGKVFQVF